LRFQAGNSPQGGTRVSRDGFAAELSQSPVTIDRYGVLVGNEIAELTDVGYQKIWLTKGGQQLAATAAHLRGLHSFIEDLREGLGLTSLYNEGLGSVNENHLYDRVTGRDTRHEKKPWEISQR
jgi:hypothetical protein